MAASPSKLGIVAAFAAVYLIWGSTYLAIRVAVETLPPLLMAGIRFVFAGASLYALLRWRGAARPSAAHWRAAAIVGGLLLLGGNGLVVWAEQSVPSGIAALLVATVPLWIVILGAAGRGGTRPAGRELIGLALGTAGVCTLFAPQALAGDARAAPTDLFGAAGLVLASLLWAIGSLYSRRANLPRSPLLATAMEMICGGALQLLVGLLMGEAARFDPGRVAPRSIVAMLYLIVFGSWIGFSAYVWLLRVARPASVATYAYVNPIVAVLLGALLLSELLTFGTLVAMGLIVAGVVLITTARRR
ncbi:MAG: putative inner membrane transporter YedA [Phycisphaerae bacterium]|nr:putative inner membrane transporter YedA [Phycisphaerae bacterium]